MARHKGPRTRFKALLALLGVFSLLMMGAVSLTSPAAATGNNGTIKIHEEGTPSGTESNDPKVCSFNIEGFGFDPNQTGYIVFDVQGGDGPTGTPAGPYDFGPTNADGYYATQYFSLEEGHYKATLYDDADNEKAKSKVFKVDCEEDEVEPGGNLNVSSTCESITFSSSGVKPEGAEQVFKLDGVVKAPGTYPVTPGSHTVELFVNGEKVDTETIVVKECEDEQGCPETGYQDENPTADCYVEREPDVREKSSERENCRLGGVVTTHAVYTTTYSFNETTQQWESSETATSSQNFEPYTAAELREKGCVKGPDSNPDNPDNPTTPVTPTSNTPTTADTGLWTEEPASKNGSALWGMAAVLVLMSLGFLGYGARRRGQES